MNNTVNAQGSDFTVLPLENHAALWQEFDKSFAFERCIWPDDEEPRAYYVTLSHIPGKWQAEMKAKVESVFADYGAAALTHDEAFSDINIGAEDFTTYHVVRRTPAVDNELKELTR